MAKYLDENGLSYFWSKLKNFFAQKTELPGIVSKSAAGLTPRLPNETAVTKFLRQDGSWDIPTDTTYEPASSNPLMDGNAATGTSAKYAREDHIHPTDTSRYSTSGGNISGDVDVNGTLKFNIPDDDYTVDITFDRRLDLNRGTILSLSGNASGTPYKVAIEGVGTPVNDYDAANKRYVDQISSIMWITGTVDSHGIVVSSSAYDNCYDAVTTNKSCYLKLIDTDGVHVMRLKSWLNYNDHSQYQDSFLFVDAVTGYDTKTVIINHNGASYSETELEQTVNRITDWSSTPSDDLYPSEKLVRGAIDYIVINYQRRPVVIYETDGSTGIDGLNTDISTSLAWQITNVDLTPYKRLKFYVKSNGPSAANLRPAMIVEMILDSRSTSSLSNGYYTASAIAQYPNNSNRLVICTFVVNDSKTAIAFLRHTSLYGTAATSAAGDGSVCYLIEGYYD